MEFYDFPIILGISSSQLTNSYFSEGLKPPTRYIYICRYIDIVTQKTIEKDLKFITFFSIFLGVAFSCTVAMYHDIQLATTSQLCPW